MLHVLYWLKSWWHVFLLPDKWTCEASECVGTGKCVGSSLGSSHYCQCIDGYQGTYCEKSKQRKLGLFFYPCTNVSRGSFTLICDVSRGLFTPECDECSCSLYDKRNNIPYFFVTEIKRGLFEPSLINMRTTCTHSHTYAAATRPQCSGDAGENASWHLYFYVYSTMGAMMT